MGGLAVVTVLLVAQASVAYAEGRCGTGSPLAKEAVLEEAELVVQAADQSPKLSDDELETVLKALAPSSLIARGGGDDIPVERRSWKSLDPSVEDAFDVLKTDFGEEISRRSNSLGTLVMWSFWGLGDSQDSATYLYGPDGSLRLFRQQGQGWGDVCAPLFIEVEERRPTPTTWVRQLTRRWNEGEPYDAARMDCMKEARASARTDPGWMPKWKTLAEVPRVAP